MTKRTRRSRRHNKKRTFRGGYVSSSSSLTDKLNFVTGYGIGVAAIAALIWLVPQYPSVIRGSLGHGTAGTFVAERKDCGKYSCNWFGTFTSDDGSVVRKTHANHGVHFIGDSAREVYSGDPNAVYSPSGSYDWLWMGFVLALCVGYLTFLAKLTRSLRSRSFRRR